MIKQDEKLKKLVTSRQSKLETDKTSFNDRMQDIADFVCPLREDILGNLQKGHKKGTKIYDGTAVSAAVLATDGIHGYHVSPAFPWFKYEMNRKYVNKIREVQEWLQELEHNMYMALNRSNFYSEMWPYIYDGFTIGTAAIFPEEDLAEEKISFTIVHPGEIFIEEDKFGEVDIFHRKRKLSNHKIIQMFGDDSPEEIKAQAESQPFHEHEFIHAVYPREDFNDSLKDAKNKRFASVWLATGTNHICRVSGFDRFPYKVWRYMKSGKEVFGISPAMLAMADIKGVNLMSKTLLGAAQLSIDPALNVPSYLEGKVNIKPRGFNYYNENTQDKITPVNTGGNYPVGVDREEAKQKAIRERFHVDTFLMLTQLGGQGQRTAYEVSEMMAEKAAVLGAELGPLNIQIDGILDHVFDIETAAGRMPGPPDIIYELAEQDPSLRFDPVYMGPLAQSQREKFGKDPIRKFFIDLSPLAEVQPEVLDNFDLDIAAVTLAEINNLPADIIRDPELRDEIRQGRLEAAQQANQMESAEQIANTAKIAGEINPQLIEGIQGAIGA